MPRKVVPLSDTKINSLQAQDNPVFAFDEDGPFLLVSPKDGKW